MGPVEPDATYTCGPHCKSERDLRDRLQDLTNLTFQDNRDEWFRFAEELELDLVFVDHLCDVVHEGKWRDEAKVKKFLKREARKRGLEQDAIERELYPEAEAPSFHRFAGEAQAAKRLRVARQPTFAELGNGDLSGEDVAEWKLHKLEAGGARATNLTEREREEIQSWRDWYARLVRKDVDDLLKNPEIRRLLGPELIEVAVARSHNLTRDAFIEDGAWWLLRGQVDERESTLEEKKSRQAAWRRLTDLIERNPILHQRPAVQYGDLNDLLKFGHEGSARLNALRNNETGRHNITRKNPRYATILQTSLLTKGFSLS